MIQDIQVHGKELAYGISWQVEIGMEAEIRHPFQLDPPWKQSVIAATQDFVLAVARHAVGPCIGPTIDLNSRFAGGERIRIQIAENEFFGLRNGHKKATINHFLVKVFLSYSKINQQVILLTMH